MKKTFAFLTALLLAVSLFARAEMVDTFQFKSQAERTRAVELAKSLRCPQCQNQNLVESNSPIAYDLRLEVYKMVDEGKTNQQIVDAMTARFGDFVNYKPPFQWNTALLWLLPALLLLTAFGLIWRAAGQKKLEQKAPHLTQLARLDSASRNSPPTAPMDMPQSAVKNTKVFSLILFALLLGVPLLYYASLDRWNRVEQGLQQQIEQANQQIESSPQQKNAQRLAQLQQKLRQDPNDAQHWLQLGEWYVEDNQFDNALIAYRNAERIEGAKPAILGLAATALYYQAEQQITGQVQQLLDAALQQDPNEISSLSLLAAEAFKQQNYQTALDYWQQMLDSGNAAVDRRAVIQRMKMVQFLEHDK